MLQALPAMNAIELLETQHREMEEILERLAKTPGDRSRQGNLFDDIAERFAIHAEIEERHLYPVTTHEQVIVKSVRQHLAIASMLAKLVRLHRSSRRRLGAKLELLRERVMLHVTLQEIYLFPELKQRLRELELQVLGGKMLATVRELEGGNAALTAA